MHLSLALYFLAGISGANALDISGYSRSTCATNGVGVTTCSGIYSNVCCNFPRGGLQVQSVLFSVLYDGTIGVFYASSSSIFCSTSRNAIAGPGSAVCLAGGSLSNWYGGGGAWLDCTTQCNPPGKRSLRAEDLKAVAESQTCNSSAIPTILGWEGDGVWVLQLEEGDAWDRYNELPTVDPTDATTHIKNLKAFGAEWHANATEHHIAAKFL